MTKRCRHFMAKNRRKCKRTAQHNLLYCYSHRIRFIVGICYFCCGDCSLSSQICGICSRKMTFLQ